MKGKIITVLFVIALFFGFEGCARTEKNLMKDPDYCASFRVWSKSDSLLEISGEGCPIEDAVKDVQIRLQKTEE